MQSVQVVTLKFGQQNASSVDSKSPMHSFELRTSSTLPRCSRVTSNPEVEPQKRDGSELGFGTRGIYEMGCSLSEVLDRPSNVMHFVWFRER